MSQAFNMIDQNHDGIIDIHDLRAVNKMLGECMLTYHPSSFDKFELLHLLSEVDGAVHI